MSTEQQPDLPAIPAVDAARRSLLRGSLAAPVVMTIAPGVAMAQGSMYNCVQSPTSGQEAQAQPDGFYRVAVVANNVQQTNGTRWLFQADGKYYLINADPMSTSFGDVSLVSIPPTTTGQTKTFYVVKLFDEQTKSFGFPTQLNQLEPGWVSFGATLPNCYNSIVASLPR
jgi:hypothetical protein